MQNEVQARLFLNHKMRFRLGLCLCAPWHPAPHQIETGGKLVDRLIVYVQEEVGAGHPTVPVVARRAQYQARIVGPIERPRYRAGVRARFGI